MSFYDSQTESMVESATSGIHLHTITNLAEAPQANVIIVHGLSSYAKMTPLLVFLLSMIATFFAMISLAMESQKDHGDIWIL